LKCSTFFCLNLKVSDGNMTSGGTILKHRDSKKLKVMSFITNVSSKINPQFSPILKKTYNKNLKKKKRERFRVLVRFPFLRFV